MKAVRRSTYGPPEILSVGEAPKPSPQKGDLLIRVHATTVNRTDCGILRGKPFLIRFFTGLFKPSSPVPGTDFAGEVEAVGADVDAFKPGDRVFGLRDEGLASQAEYMVIKATKAVAKIPEQYSFEEAVTAAEGAHYAINMINKVKLQPHDKVLVYGATGAIGSAAVQILKYQGFYVTAVGNTKNVALLHQLGADEVVDYQTQDFTQTSTRYACVIDAVGKSRFRTCTPLLQPKGTYLSSELGPNAENLWLPIITKIKGKKRSKFPVPSNCKRSIWYMQELMAKQQFMAVIDREYPMEEVRQAYEYVETGQKTGNVVLRVLQVG